MAIKLRSWQSAFCVLMFFVLPHLALRFSSVPFVNKLNAVFLLVLFCFFLVSSVSRFRFPKLWVIIFAILGVVLLFGLSRGLHACNTLSIALKSGYETLGPIFLFVFVLFSRATVVNFERSLVFPVLLFGLINGIYSTYQRFFLEDYRDLWFYYPLTKMGKELHEWSFVVEDAIRSPGLFTSPLENSFFLLFLTFYFFVKTVNRSFLYAFPLLMVVALGYLTGVRTYFVAGIIGVFSWIIIRFSSLPHPIILFLIAPALSVVGTYLFLFMQGDIMDLSAMGRLKQLWEMVDALLAAPGGYGLGCTGMGTDLSFDSANGIWLLTYGLLGGSAIIGAYYAIARSLLWHMYYESGLVGRELLAALVLFSSALMYVSQFQYAMITPTRWYYAFAAAIVINSMGDRHGRLSRMILTFSHSSREIRNKFGSGGIGVLRLVSCRHCQALENKGKSR